MDKEVMCPWCGQKTKPKLYMKKMKYGKVRERRCGYCGKVLAAYLADEGDFMKGVRKYEN